MNNGSGSASNGGLSLSLPNRLGHGSPNAHQLIKPTPFTFQRHSPPTNAIHTHAQQTHLNATQRRQTSCPANYIHLYNSGAVPARVPCPAGVRAAAGTARPNPEPLRPPTPTAPPPGPPGPCSPGRVAQCDATEVGYPTWVESAVSRRECATSCHCSAALRNETATAPRGPALRCVHTKHSQKACPFSVARLKLDLPFHNRLAYNRVHRKSVSLLTAPGQRSE